MDRWTTTLTTGHGDGERMRRENSPGKTGGDHQGLAVISLVKVHAAKPRKGPMSRGAIATRSLGLQDAQASTSRGLRLQRRGAPGGFLGKKDTARLRCMARLHDWHMMHAVFRGSARMLYCASDGSAEKLCTMCDWWHVAKIPHLSFLLWDAATIDALRGPGQ